MARSKKPYRRSLEILIGSGFRPSDLLTTVLAAMERWRKSGAAPEQIVAIHVNNNRVDMTRPLCPYPQVAVYKGVGSTNDAGNFACRTP